VTALSTTPQTYCRFRIRVLGPFALERDGSSVDLREWPPQARTLLRVLATAPERRILRDDLIELLWPQATPKAAASNVRRVVHLLRRALGADERSLILSKHGSIALNPAYEWEVDLDQFEARLAGAGDDPVMLERVARLYRGEPLVEDRYADWAAPVRERVHHTWRRLCLRLAEQYRARAMPAEAIEWLERPLLIDPLDGEVVQQLLVLLGQLGRRGEAVRLYRRFEQRLRSELGVAPLPDTLAAVDRLTAHHDRAEHSSGDGQTGSAAALIPTYPLPALGTLVGRGTEVMDILRPMMQDGSSRLSLILLAAEAGIGKTRLLAEAAWRAREAGALTLAGGSYEQEGRLPYGPIHDALLDYVRCQSSVALRQRFEGLFEELARIVPELHDILPMVTVAWPGDADSQRLRLFAGVARIFERIAAERPIILLLDDLHWADEATLQLLHFLGRHLGGSDLLIVAAFRSEEMMGESSLSMLVAETKRSEWGRCISLGSLSEAELSRMLSERLADPCSPTLVHELFKRSVGNPFVALQTQRLLQQEGALEKTGDGWHLATSAVTHVPEEVRTIVARRLHHLGEATREMLSVAAVLGREFPYPALEAMWEGDEKPLFATLDEAVRAQLLRETEHGYAFRHPILWEVVYSAIGRPRRARLHGRAGLALKTLYHMEPEGHAAELAHHFVEAGSAQAERATRYLILAGESAARSFAWDAAECHFRDSVELLDATGTQVDAAKARERLGNVLTTMARNDDALGVLESAAEVYGEVHDAESEGRVLAQIGRVYMDRGMMEAGIARIEPAMPRLEGQISDRTAASLYLALSHLFRRAGRYDDAMTMTRTAAGLASPTQDIDLLAEVETWRSNIMMYLKDIGGALALAKKAVRLAEASGNLGLQVPATHNLAHLCSVAGQGSAAHLFYDRTIELTERLGDPSAIVVALCDSGLLMYNVGDWSEARSRVQRALSLSHALPSSPSAYPHLYLGMVQLAQGYRDEGAANLETSLAIARAIDDMRALQHASWLLARADIQEGRAGQAVQRLEEIAAQPSKDDINFAQLLPILAWAHLEQGRVQDAQREVAQALGLSERTRSEALIVWALRVHAVILANQERWLEAHEALNRAAHFYGEQSCQYDEAQVLELSGQVWIRQGCPEQAVRRLRKALSLFQLLGARRDANRVGSELERIAGTEP
jgi:DNA-binding SARP family transcriptional activator